MSDVERKYLDKNDDGFNYLRSSTCNPKKCKACIYRSSKWVCDNSFNKKINTKKINSKNINVFYTQQITNKIHKILSSKVMNKHNTNKKIVKKQHKQIGGSIKNILNNSYLLEGVKINSISSYGIAKNKHYRNNKKQKGGIIKKQKIRKNLYVPKTTDQFHYSVYRNKLF